RPERLAARPLPAGADAVPGDGQGRLLTPRGPRVAPTPAARHGRNLMLAFAAPLGYLLPHPDRRPGGARREGRSAGGRARQAASAVVGGAGRTPGRRRPHHGGRTDRPAP